MKKHRLRIGQSDFQCLREEGCYNGVGLRQTNRIRIPMATEYAMHETAVCGKGKWVFCLSVYNRGIV
jgi:hypothetical protein